MKSSPRQLSQCNLRLGPLCLLGLALVVAATSSGCIHDKAARGAAHDRPFPLGTVTDAHWETQQTNAEAADFIVYTHEFRGDSVELGPAGRRHLEEMALRLHQVPFPVVVATVENDANPDLDRRRRDAIAHYLAAMGVAGVESRVVSARSFAEGVTAVEAEAAYRRGVLSRGAGIGVGAGGGGRGGGATYR